MSMSVELEPCPFCGSEQQAITPAWAVMCKACAAYVTGDTEAEAIQAWNTRTPSTPHVGDDVREALEKLRVDFGRCADIVDRHLYRQHEKVEDVRLIAFAAIARIDALLSTDSVPTPLVDGQGQ